MNHCRASHIEQVFALSARARPLPLPTPSMGQGMFDRHALPQFYAAFWHMLMCPQLAQQPFFRVHREATSTDTARALRLHRTVAHVVAGKCPTCPSWNGMVMAFGHRMVPVSLSTTAAVLAQRGPCRSGHALQNVSSLAAPAHCSGEARSMDNACQVTAWAVRSARVGSMTDASGVVAGVHPRRAPTHSPSRATPAACRHRCAAADSCAVPHLGVLNREAAR
jgi:hypothetical protein